MQILQQPLSHYRRKTPIVKDLQIISRQVIKKFVGQYWKMALSFCQAVHDNVDEIPPADVVLVNFATCHQLLEVSLGVQN